MFRFGAQFRSARQAQRCGWSFQDTKERRSVWNAALVLSGLYTIDWGSEKKKKHNRFKSCRLRLQHHYEKRRRLCFKHILSQNYLVWKPMNSNELNRMKNKLY